MPLREKIGLLIFVALLTGTLMLLHASGMNGPWYWQWPWQRLPAIETFGLILAATIPFFIGVMLDQRNRRRRAWSIGLLMLACFAMKIAAAAAMGRMHGIEMMRGVIENPRITSYYTDAQSLSRLPLRQWLADYPRMMANLNLHSQTKPPGPILYWIAMIRFFGGGFNAELIGGLLLGAIATAAIPATYGFLKLLTADDRAAFCGAAFLSLCPGFILFFPMLDPTYILLSTGLIAAWFAALQTNRLRYSAAAGLLLASLGLVTFNVLVIAPFMLGVAVFDSNQPPATRMKRTARHATVVLLVATLTLGLIWCISGYDVIATFRAAVQNQQIFLHSSMGRGRKLPDTIVFDLMDFILGSGWISLPLLVYYFLQKPVKPIALLAIGQVILVALLGVLQAETARVWNFMLPLLMLPIGLELARWPGWARLLCYGCLVLLTCVICQNMQLLF